MKIPNGCWTGSPESEQQPKAKAGCHAMKATRPSRGKPLLDGGLHFGEKQHTVRCDEKERKEGIQPWPKGTWPESSVPQKQKEMPSGPEKENLSRHSKEQPRPPHASFRAILCWLNGSRLSLPRWAVWLGAGWKGRVDRHHADSLRIRLGHRI